MTATDTGGPGVRQTYYALNKPTCSATNLTDCTPYIGPFGVHTNGLYTLTYFSLDTAGLDEAVQTKSFAVALTTSPVTGATIGIGTNPTVTTGGAAGTPGSVSVSGTGTGLVGAAVYGSNPAGPDDVQ